MSKLQLKTQNLLSSNIFFFILTSLIILILNLFPLISHIRHAPTGRTFALIHNNVQDFFFYQALMNEGASSSWLTYDPYTTESHQSSIIFSYFLWLGKLSKLLGLSYAVTYHISRIILGILLLSVICYLLSVLKVPHPKLTYLLFLFASPFMKGDTPYMNWWTGMDPIRRVAYLPHHMMGSLLLVVSIILLVKHFQNNSKFKSQNAKLQVKIQNYKYLLLVILIAPILAFVHTPSLFILLLILPPTIGLQIALRHLGGDRLIPLSGRSHDSREVERPVIWLLVYWFTGLLALLFMISQTKNGFPWSQYIDWEKNLQFPLARELIGALGILFPFSLIGIWQALKSKKFENILTACWLFIPFLVIPFAQKLNISNIRLIQGTPYLPLAILAMMGISKLQDILTKKLSLINSNLKTQISKPKLKALNLFRFADLRFRFDICDLTFAIFLLLFIIFTYPTLSWSLKDQIREYWPIYSNVYLDDRLNNAFSFINQNFPPKTVTLSTFYTGNYLPAFTKTVSFIGHFGYTYNMEEKEKQVRTFLENKMTEEQAGEFIKNNKIALIFQGPEEKPIYNDYLYPKLLKPVYDKEEITLYTLK